MINSQNPRVTEVEIPHQVHIHTDKMTLGLFLLQGEHCHHFYDRCSKPLITFVTFQWTSSSISMIFDLGKPKTELSTLGMSHQDWSERKDQLCLPALLCQSQFSQTISICLFIFCGEKIGFDKYCTLSIVRGRNSEGFKKILFVNFKKKKVHHSSEN